MSGTVPAGDGADRGLQPERTSLAWRRTGLAAATAALVMVRVAAARDVLVVAGLAGALAVVSLAALLEGSVRHAARRDGFDAGAPVPHLSLAARATVATTVALAAAGLWLAIAR